MSSLLPPQVVGPVVVGDTSVSVTGARSGSEVTLLQNGQVINADIADLSGNAVINVPAGSLVEGALLTAVQSSGAEKSEPSRFAEPVLGLPDPAPPLVILSQVHPCMDAVLVGGVVKGSTVELLHQGTVIGFQSGYGPVVYIPCQFGSPLAPGDVVTVRQRYVKNGVTLTSPEVPSLPLQALPLPPRDHDRYTLTAPYIDGPLYECATAVTVRGILPGATIELFNGTQNETYWYQGGAINVGVPQLRDGMKLHAQQAFNRCSMQSPPSADGPVTRASLPGRPRIQEPVCPNAMRVTLHDLDPGALVTIGVRLDMGNNSYAYHYWEATAAKETQSFDLPADLKMEWAQPPQTIFAYQRDCNDNPGPSTDHIPFEAAGASSLAMGPLTECQRRVRVETTTPGVAVRLYSDRDPALASPAMSYGPFVDIDLYRGLFADEKVTAVAASCGGGPDARVDVRVDRLGQLPAPDVVDPVREWMTAVLVKGCLPGARVHVFVNELWRGSADALSDTCDVYVGDLRADRDSVMALQTLCTQISHYGQAVVVTKGVLKVSHKPATIIRGPQKQQIVIEAQDADFGHGVNAAVFDTPSQSQVGTTGSALWQIFPYFQNGPAWHVQAQGYRNTPVVWSLGDSKPVAAFNAQPMRGPYPLAVHFTDQSVGAISSWKWEFGYRGATSNSKNATYTYVTNNYGGYKARLTVTGPGGSDTAEKLIDVYFPDPNNPQVTGYSKVQVVNANLNYFPNFDPNAHKSLTIYRRDLTTGSGWSNEGDIDVGDHLDVDLPADGHQYAIACVDKDMTGCNGNNPDIYACVREGMWVTSKSSGPVLVVPIY